MEPENSVMSGGYCVVWSEWESASVGGVPYAACCPVVVVPWGCAVLTLSNVCGYAGCVGVEWACRGAHSPANQGCHPAVLSPSRHSQAPRKYATSTFVGVSRALHCCECVHVAIASVLYLKTWCSPVCMRDEISLNGHFAVDSLNRMSLCTACHPYCC